MAETFFDQLKKKVVTGVESLNKSMQSWTDTAKLNSQINDLQSRIGMFDKRLVQQVYTAFESVAELPDDIKATMTEISDAKAQIEGIQKQIEERRQAEAAARAAKQSEKQSQKAEAPAETESAPADNSGESDPVAEFEKEKAMPDSAWKPNEDNAPKIDFSLLDSSDDKSDANSNGSAE